MTLMPLDLLKIQKAPYITLSLGQNDTGREKIRPKPHPSGCSFFNGLYLFFGLQRVSPHRLTKHRNLSIRIMAKQYIKTRSRKILTGFQTQMFLVQVYHNQPDFTTIKLKIRRNPAYIDQLSKNKKSPEQRLSRRGKGTWKAKNTAVRPPIHKK